MKRLFSVGLMVIAATALFTSCKKDVDADLGRTEILTAGSWQVVQALGQINGDPWEDVTADNFEPCYIDNRYSFASSGIVTQDEGPTRCFPTDEQTQTKNWNFSNGQTRINFSNVLWDIEELTDSSFVISITESSGGDSGTYKVILKH